MAGLCAGLVGLVFFSSVDICVASSVVGCGSTCACYMVVISGCVLPPVIYVPIYVFVCMYITFLFM